MMDIDTTESGDIVNLIGKRICATRDKFAKSRTELQRTIAEQKKLLDEEEKELIAKDIAIDIECVDANAPTASTLADDEPADFGLMLEQAEKLLSENEKEGD